MNLSLLAGQEINIRINEYGLKRTVSREYYGEPFCIKEVKMFIVFLKRSNHAKQKNLKKRYQKPTKIHAKSVLVATTTETRK